MLAKKLKLQCLREDENGQPDKGNRQPETPEEQRGQDYNQEYGNGDRLGGIQAPCETDQSTDHRAGRGEYRKADCQRSARHARVRCDSMHHIRFRC